RRHLRPPLSTPFPYTTLFRSLLGTTSLQRDSNPSGLCLGLAPPLRTIRLAKSRRTRRKTVNPSRKGLVFLCLAASLARAEQFPLDRESTRLNSSHLGISYAVF